MGRHRADEVTFEELVEMLLANVNHGLRLRWDAALVFGLPPVDRADGARLLLGE
jgi:hypothetical protein